MAEKVRLKAESEAVQAELGAELENLLSNETRPAADKVRAFNALQSRLAEISTGWGMQSELS